MNIEQAKRIPLVNILAHLGYQPVRVSGKRYSYRSPMRNERTPSFMVDIQLNTWHDFGQVKEKDAGGDTLDFARLYAGIEDVSGALGWLSRYETAEPVTHTSQQYLRDAPAQTFQYKVQPLNYRPLLDYLANRGITQDVAIRYCKEIWYTYNGKQYFGVAFPTRTENYEVRNRYDKRCVGHKDISHIRICADKPTSECCVFEGFIDFLSYVMLFRQKHPLAQYVLCDCIVLNSVSSLRKALPELEGYSTIHCYLDNDPAGRTATTEIAAAFPRATIDESPRYALANDVNDYLMTIRGLKKGE